MEEPSKANELGVSPLGLTIARKQLEGSSNDLLGKKETTQPRKPSRKQKQTTTTSYTKKALDGKPPKNASWMAFLEGITLYGTCLVLPSLIGMILRREEQQWMWNQLQLEICEQSAWLCWNLFGAVLEPEPTPPEPLTFAKNFVAPDTNYWSDMGVVLFMTFSMALLRVLLVHWLVPNHLAPQQMEALVRCKSIHLLSSDYKRTLTPRMERTVMTTDSFPKEQSPQLPSLPLFPGEEEQSPTGRDLGYEKLEYKTDKDGKQQQNSNHQDDDFFFRRLSSNDLGLGFDDEEDDEDNHNAPNPNQRIIQTGGFLPPCCPQQEEKSEQSFLGDFGEDENDDDHRPQSPLHMPPDSALEQDSNLPFGSPARGQEGEEGSLGWKRRGSTASLAAAAAAAVQEEEDHHEDEEAAPLPRPQRLFAAPRYATAVFRLLYCTLSGAMAWYLFRDSDFWPSYVGGHGRTARCWDLGGSLSLAKSLDSDFDHRNTVLRRFFLVQASYHLHSGAFHVFSVVLLHCLKKDDAKPNEKKTFTNWILPLLRSLIHPRAMFQHSLSLIFLSVSYVFSSLRRLGAIGMFALDMSSWALHLLQTCLNAPADSVLSKPKVIKGVWGLVVLPSFFYFRFYVWPMLGYSSIGESEQWLAQLESTLVPGSALWFRRTFLLWMTLWMGFHAIHFKRLVFHPHIQRIMGTGGEQYASVEQD